MGMRSDIDGNEKLVEVEATSQICDTEEIALNEDNEVSLRSEANGDEKTVEVKDPEEKTRRMLHSGRTELPPPNSRDFNGDTTG